MIWGIWTIVALLVIGFELVLGKMDDIIKILNDQNFERLR